MFCVSFVERQCYFSQLVSLKKKKLKHKRFSLYFRSVDRYCIYALSVEMKLGSRIPEVCLRTAWNRGLLSLLGGVAACGAT